MRYRTAASCGACDPWNNGKEVPRWGVAEIQKMSPSTTGRCYDVIVVTNSPPIGLMRSQLTNHQVGIILDVQAWSEKLLLDVQTLWKK